jgi:flagellar basal-body rod modification protein FlgD
MSVAATNTDHSSVIAAINNAGAKAAQTAAQEMSDRFMKLLVTQLRNQDPMNPMENAEMTSQLAQMSTVEGISKLNASMENLLAGYQSAQTLQATALIGHQVLTEGSIMTLSEGLAAGAVDLAAAADKVTVTVLNSAGQVLDSLDLGAQEAGQVRFGWDGKDAAGNVMADGTYRFVVSAEAAGKDITATRLALVPVSSVSLSNGTVSLELKGIGQRSLDQVKQIF